MFEALGEIIGKLGPLAGLFKGKTQHLPFSQANQVATQYAQQVYNILARLYGGAAVNANGKISNALRVRLLNTGDRWTWQSSPQHQDMATRNGLNVYQLLDLFYTFALQQYDVARPSEMQGIMVADLDTVKNSITDAGFDAQEFADGLQIVAGATGISLNSPTANVLQFANYAKWIAIGAAIFFGGKMILKGATK